jgi:hypothetical protein
MRPSPQLQQSGLQHGLTSRLVLRRSWSRMETLSSATVTQESSTQNTGNGVRDRRFPNLMRDRGEI